MPLVNIEKLNARHLISCAALVTATFLCFGTALNSVFLFDDFHNLEALAQIQGKSIFSPDFWEFVFSGIAGPTGRPVSLFTFALQADSWPNNPASFKSINLLIHCLNALLAYSIFFQLSRLMKLEDDSARKIALCTSMLWAIHPVHTTVVLYAVQRMALLSNLFILIGISLYLHFRSSCGAKNQPRQLLMLSIALILAGFLALFSKENAPSLIFFLLVLEYTVLSELPKTNLFIKWRYLFLWAPALLTVILSLIYIPQLQQNFAASFEYSLLDRLMTESRILWQYMAILIFPSTSGTSLFHDINASASLFAPLTTIFSLLAWIALAVFGVVLKGRHKILLFAVFWFFAGHIIESSILPLELFFNHRNYLAFLGIIFMVFYSLFTLIPHKLISNQVKIIFPIIYGILLTFQTVNISRLWNEPLQLSQSWYLADPETTRNAEFHAINLANTNQEGMLQAAKIYENILSQNPNNFRLLLNRMTLSCLTASIPRPGDAFILETLELVDAESRDLFSPLQQLVTFTTTNACNIYSTDLLINILTDIKITQPKQTQGLYEFELARLKFYTGDDDAGINLLYSSYALGGDPGVLFSLTLRFINAGRYEEALDTIDQAIVRLKTYNNIRSGTRTSKLSTLYEMRTDVLAFIEMQ